MNIVDIGNTHGKIALYLDREEAIDLALLYGPEDRAYDELMSAVARAYPINDEEEPKAP